MTLLGNKVFADVTKYQDEAAPVRVGPQPVRVASRERRGHTDTERSPREDGGRVEGRGHKPRSMQGPQS